MADIHLRDFDLQASRASVRSMDSAANAATGKLFGFVGVVSANETYNLTNAAEERSFGMASKVESLTVRQRNITPRRAPKLYSLAEVQELFDTMQVPDSEETLRLLSRQILATLKENRSPRQFLRERFSDATKRYLALCYAYQNAKYNGASSQDVERLLDLLAEADASEGSVVQAGVNTVDVVAEFNADPAEGDRFRKVYRDAVLDYQSFGATLDSVLTQFGDANFEQGSRLLLKALAADLHSVHPSSNPVRLHAILQDLYSLEAVSSFLIRCSDILESYKHINSVTGLNATSMAHDLLHLIMEPYVTAYRFADMATKYGVTEEEAQVEFFTGALGAIRSLPMKVFRNEEARFKAIEAVQSALDALLLGDEV